MNLPRISLITPSFNQAAFLEKTITSILDQKYPNLEYIIIDGGSTDGSVDIIRKYAPQLAYWVSEKDRGQTHAINKGLERATGDILAYLNSDDYYLPGTLQKVADFSCANPDVDLMHGRCRIVDTDGNKIGERSGAIHNYGEILDLWEVWWKKRNFVQPEVFWTKRITNKIGPFREDLHWVMDYEYWLRILRAEGKVGSLDSELACFRIQANQKSTQPERTSEELLKVVHPFIWEKSNLISWKQRFQLKGKWAFDALFRKEALRSSTHKEGRSLRLLRLAGLTLRNPQMLTFEPFRQRMLSALLPSSHK